MNRKDRVCSAALSAVLALSLVTAPAQALDTTGAERTEGDYAVMAQAAGLNVSAIDSSGIVYNGKAQTPTPKVTADGKQLVAGTDFRVEYGNNVHAGTGVAYVLGMGKYTGLVESCEFTIHPAKLVVKVDDVQDVKEPASYTYSILQGTLAPGDSLGQPKYSVKDNGNGTKTVTMAVKANADYDITVLSGTLTIVQTLGTVTISGPSNVYYNGSEQTPKPTVKDAATGKTLTEGKDYTLTYRDNVNAGKASVTITGLGSYRDVSEVRSFTVQPAPITVRIRDIRCSIRDNNQTFRYDITSGSLAPGDSLGQPKYTVYSKTGYSYGPYFGIRAEFPVNENYDITVREGTMTYYDVDYDDDDVISTEFRVVVKDVYYDGSYQEPTVKVYDRYNNRLTEGEDYTLSFTDNRRVGTATVFVTGINSYRGVYATEHFEILSNHSDPDWNDRYTIEASASDGGRISPSGTNTVREDSDKTFYFYANSGYEIIGVYVDNEYVGTKSSYTFRDVTEDHEIYVEFAKRNSSARYDITILSSYGGTVTPNDDGSITVARGNDRTFYFEPDTGYAVSAVYVDGTLVSARNNQYTFTNVRDDHTLRVEFTRTNGYWGNGYWNNGYWDNNGNWHPSGNYDWNHDWTQGWTNPYGDVNSSAWYYNALSYMTSRGIVNGVSNNVFSPNTPVSRGELVLLLYRICGSPNPGRHTYFNDVAATSPFAHAIYWAAENGIVTGYGDNSFKPYASVTREQAAAILYRYASYRGFAYYQENGILNAYADFYEVSSYAVRPLSWAATTGILVGQSNQTLGPHYHMTRAETIVMLYRFCTMFGQ